MIIDELQEQYDRIIADTLAEIKRTKPLTKQKLTALLMKANKAYWAIRIAMTDTDAVKSADELAKALAAPYAVASETITDRVRNVYANYRSAFDLSKADADELMKNARFDKTIAQNLTRLVEKMDDGAEKQRILAEISAPAYQFRMEQAEEITRQAREISERIARNEISADRQLLQTEIEKAYNIAIEPQPSEAVLDNIFTPTTEKGVQDSFSLISEKKVRQITNNDWSGEEFSERIWNNTAELAKEVKQVLIEGELTGASEADMAEKISERFEVAMYKARRVVRTEQNYCMNQAELKAIKDAGFDEYEFVTLGENAEGVCDTCDDLDGQRFKVADATVGVNCPPMHPFCRCKVTTPQQSEEDIQREIDERIESWNIPEGMSFDEFIDRVNNGELEQIRAEQAEKAGRSDVTDEYLEKATPGVGTLSYDSECTKDEVALEKYQDELDFAEWIHNTLGGDIHVNAEDDHTNNIKFPDYLWRGKLWDLKTPESENGANGRVKDGIEQIKNNCGGIMINYKDKDINYNKLEQILDKRMHWYKDITVDIMVVNNGDFVVYRYKK